MTFQQQFSGKTVALTGAASGIGLSCAHLLASRGANLSLADLQKEALEKVKADIESQYKTKVLIFPLDVRNSDQVSNWITTTVKECGKLDGAANLAGVIPKTIGKGWLVDQDMNDFDFVMDVNLKGVLHCLKAQLLVMGEGGAIVNAASIAALMGRDKNSSYSASKHAVLGLTKSAAKEVGVKGIRVNAICPGRIDTPMARNAAEIASAATSGGPPPTTSPGSQASLDFIALRREGKPEEVAKLVAFLLSEESSYISGQGISIDGGWFC
jgi:NAD(P)-dependent dehydrogenase (short-subunit alcohol dehydrogenase family)